MGVVSLSQLNAVSPHGPPLLRSQPHLGPRGPPLGLCGPSLHAGLLNPTHEEGQKPLPPHAHGSGLARLTFIADAALCLSKDPPTKRTPSLPVSHLLCWRECVSSGSAVLPIAGVRAHQVFGGGRGELSHTGQGDGRRPSRRGLELLLSTIASGVRGVPKTIWD